jgi:hypothetical protein
MSERTTPCYHFFPAHTQPDKMVRFLQQELASGLQIVDFIEVGVQQLNGWLFQLEESDRLGIEQQISYIPRGKETEITAMLAGKYLERMLDVKTGYLLIWSEQSPSLVGIEEGFLEVLFGRWIPNLWPVWFVTTILSLYFWIK